MRRYIVFTAAILIFPIHTFEKKHYQFSHDPIDVIIPCHEKDAVHLERAIEGIKKMCGDYGVL